MLKMKLWSWVIQVALAGMATIANTGCDTVTTPQPVPQLEVKGTWVVYQELGYV